MTLSRCGSWLMFTPFLVAIVVGLVVGVVSLLITQSLQIWWRLLIGVLYLPTVVFSLLLAGF